MYKTYKELIQSLPKTFEKNGEKYEIKYFKTVQKDVDEKEQTITSIISSERTDRVGDIIRMQGLETDMYIKKNPVVFADHDHTKPVGKALWLKQSEEDGKPIIIAKTQFAKTQLGQERFYLHKNGFLNSWSVGIIVKDYTEMSSGGWDITSSELYEYSSVGVPANPDAVDIEKAGINDPKLLAALEGYTADEVGTAIKMWQLLKTISAKDKLEDKIIEFNKALEEREDKYIEKEKKLDTEAIRGQIQEIKALLGQAKSLGTKNANKTIKNGG